MSEAKNPQIFFTVKTPATALPNGARSPAIRSLRRLMSSSSSLMVPSSSSQAPPEPGTAFANMAASLLIVVFGFIFVTVSARIVGIVGSSASARSSGMKIATLRPPPPSSSARAGHPLPSASRHSPGESSASRLKRGEHRGPEDRLPDRRHPRKQQLAIMIGVIVSLSQRSHAQNAMNSGLESFQRIRTQCLLGSQAPRRRPEQSGNFTPTASPSPTKSR